MHVYIYSLHKILYEGDADIAVLPAADGELSILKNHIPLITKLGKGTITLKKGASFDEHIASFDVTEGVAQVSDDSVTIIATG